MSAHQIIYTSCRRGIHDGGDGKQVYSQDPDFQGVDEEEKRSLFSYALPDLGCPMTDSLVQAMPRAYKYQRLRSGMLALALNTYLGRDYMGERGRFGNHLSHVVVCGPEDMTAYPAEYYGGDLLRGDMSFEEVNSPDPPPALPAPVVERSFFVTAAAAADFLAEAGRMEIYKQMLCAALSFGRTAKRVVILDEPENIILWIAALGYALPRRNAMEISFSTYERVPARSPCRVCGTVREGIGDGTGYFVFDLPGGSVPSLETDPAFSAFVDTAFSFSFDDLWGFHDFLDRYGYDKADEDIYRAFALYAVLTGGPESVPAERLDQALDFAGRFAGDDEILRVARLLMPGDPAAGDAGIAAKLLDAFAVNAVRLTGMAAALDDCLTREEAGRAEAMWGRFAGLLLSRYPAGMEEAFALLHKRGRPDRAYLAYRLALSQARGPEDCEAVYKAHDRALVQKSPEYAALYGDMARDAYRAARGGFPNTILRNITGLFKRRGS